MSDGSLDSASLHNGVIRETRLDSWKEIAAYLRRDVTTVRRWEKREGLPVHRHLHERRESVYAYTFEIDAWCDSRHSNVLKNEASRSSPPARIAWAVALTCVATIVVLATLLGRSAVSATDTDRLMKGMFSITPPEGVTFNHLSVSPDGRLLAFTAASSRVTGAKTLLWVRDLDSLESRAIPDTHGATFPFWSPASDAIGFFAAGHLWTIELASGTLRSIALAPQPRGGTWNRSGLILFAPSPTSGLLTVRSTGGSTMSITKPVGEEFAHVWPEFLPDGKQFLYLAGTRTAGDGGHPIVVGSLDGSTRRQVLSARSNVSYGNGHLLYQREHQLFAQAFDVRTLATTGNPVPVVDEVFAHEDAGFKSEFSVSSTDVLIFRSRQSPATRLVWRDRTGRKTAFLERPAWYQGPALSPDDDRVIYEVFDPQPSHRFGFGDGHIRGNLAIFDRRTDVAAELVADPASEWGAVWSPDGRSIVFSSQRGDTLGLFLKDMTTPNGVETALPSVGLYPVADSWSPDGRFAVFSSFDGKTGTDLWRLPMSGDRIPISLRTGPIRDYQGRISPDGRWIAYTSDESGRFEVWVASFPEPSSKRRISSEGAGDPRWRHDGKELYYVSDDRQLMAVPVEAGHTFAHGAPVALFDTGMPSYWYYARNLYDVSRDGRFLFMDPVEDDRTAPLTVVLNWAAKLKK